MSDVFFPTLPGQMFPTITSQYETIVERTKSGRRFAATYWSYPIYRISVPHEFVDRSPSKQEYQALRGFFEARRGQYDTFLWRDVWNYQVTDFPFGVGDGVTKQFALLFATGSFSGPVGYAVPDGLGIKSNGSAVGGWGLLQSRVIEFSTAPALGAVLTWSGTFAYRVAFAADELSFEQFMEQFFAVKRLDLVTVKP